MTRILWAVYSGCCKAWDMARTGPYDFHDFAWVFSAGIIHADLLHTEILHAEMDGGMVSEVEACQSPKRRYMSPEEFHEFGKNADIWLWSNPSPPPLDITFIITEEVKAFVAFQNCEFYFLGGSYSRALAYPVAPS